MNDDTVIELTPDPTPKPSGPSESLSPLTNLNRYPDPVPGFARRSTGLQAPIPPTTKPQPAPLPRSTATPVENALSTPTTKPAKPRGDQP